MNTHYSSFDELHAAMQRVFSTYYSKKFLKASGDTDRLYYKWDFDWICNETGLHYENIDLAVELETGTPIYRELKKTNHQCTI